ncbi:MAG: EAL domain-containing protein [Burkholderiales bacterium]|nr:EAL domain-containing protein [Burkholderiales bacterium]
MHNDIDCSKKVDHLLETFQTDEDALLKRLDDLGFTGQDARQLAELGPLLEQHQESFSAALFSHINGSPDLKSLTDEANTPRMRDGQLRYFRTLTAGNYDHAYVRDRLRIGIVHQHLGLGHAAYLASYQQYLAAVWPVLWEVSAHNHERYRGYLSALTKIILFDIGLELDSYSYSEKAALTEAKNAHEQLQEEYIFHQKHDELTGLPNRHLLNDRIQQALQLAEKNASTFALLHLGLDNFKLINDGMGYANGNLVLKTIADRLRHCIHEADTVSYFGSDEFVLVLKDFENSAHIAAVCERIAQAIAAPLQLNDKELHLSCCTGIALYPQDGKHGEELSTFADIALHKAKDLGHGHFQFYSSRMNEITRERIDIASDLHQAIAHGGLTLHYQPKADLRTGKVVGLEALARWEHPVRGTISPSYFVPIAEESGLIEKLGDWVIMQACRDIQAWTSAGIEAPCVALNVSPRQLQDASFATKLSGMLAGMNIDTGKISLEITESILLGHTDAIDRMLEEFKKHGFALSLDDFGTGYSALSYLKRFPFDYVKIDQSFVKELPRNTDDVSISKAIISMAHSLGIQVIAEGVETEAQCEFLSNNMCDQIQGYFFSKPLPMEQITSFLRAESRLERHLLRMEKPERTLLLVDDEPNILAALKRLLRRDGYQILTATGGHEGLEILETTKVDVIISDQRMPAMTGVEFLRHAKKSYPDTVRIVLSGYTELQYITDAINEGAIYKFLTKPWDDEQLRANIQEAFHYKEMEDENRRLNLQIQTTNQELASANRQLADMLRQKQMQINRDEVSLNIAREVLQYVPLPLIAIDDEELVVFLNDSATSIFPESIPVLGNHIASVVPELSGQVAQHAEGELFPVMVNERTYMVNWKNMGERSRSRGKIIILNR